MDARRERHRRRLEALIEQQRAKLLALDPSGYRSEASYRRAVVQHEAKLKRLEALLKNPGPFEAEP